MVYSVFLLFVALADARTQSIDMGLIERPEFFYSIQGLLLFLLRIIRYSTKPINSVKL